MYGCEDSYHFIFYPPVVPRRIANILTLEPVVLLPHSFSVEHAYVQHVGARYSGRVNLRYHSYLALKDPVLPDAISVVYYWSLKTANNAEPEVDLAQEEAVYICAEVLED